jgi:hypothetical protein
VPGKNNIPKAPRAANGGRLHGLAQWERKMRSLMTRLMVATLLVCFAMVFTSGAWARPASEPAPTLMHESSRIETFVDWFLSLIERHSALPKSPTPASPQNRQPKEGSQMDPNGHH